MSPILTRIFFAFEIIFLLTISACKNERWELSSETNTESFYNAGHAWKSTKIEACFLNGSKRQKEIIQAAAQKNYTSAKPGVEFFGFKECIGKEHPVQNSEKPIVRIYLSNGARVFSNFIGTVEVGKFESPFNQFKASIVLNDAGCEMRNEICLYNTALHELSHFVGLFHEHSRTDTGSERNCKFGSELTFNSNGISRYGKPTTLGSFDWASIMNYCVPNYFSAPLSLSTGDIAGIRKLYGLSELPVNSESDAFSGQCRYFKTASPKDSVLDSIQNTPINTAERVKEFYSKNANDKQSVSLASDAFMKKSDILLSPGTFLEKISKTIRQTPAEKNESHVSILRVKVLSGDHKGKEGFVFGNTLVHPTNDPLDCSKP
jgi:hypothetical protein